MTETSLEPEHKSNKAAMYRALARFLPAMVAASLASESMILLSAFSKFGATQASIATSFSYVMAGPLRSLWLIVLIGAVPETWLLHLLMPRHRTLEVVLLALEIWGLIWVRGYYRAMRDHPHTIEGGCVTLRFGFRRSCTVPLPSILTMKTSRFASREAFAGYREWERFCVNHCDLVELTLSPEATVDEFTGAHHRVTRLAVSFDDADSFVQAVERSRRS